MACKRMHISGGVGAIHEDEKFGPDYFLPQNAYLETCAAIGAVFFSYNMYLLAGEGKYMDAVENGLYNGSLVGVALAGNKYSYVNPLTSDGTVHRWGWHCCPPRDLKLYGKLPQLIYTQDAESLSVNLYISSTAAFVFDGRKVELRQETQYLWQGRTTIAFQGGIDREISLRLRIPAWCVGFEVTCNRMKLQAPQVQNGYLVIRGSFKKGDVIVLNLEMPVQLAYAAPQAQDYAGQVAIKRGPVLYCLEEVDNPQGIDAVIQQGTRFQAAFDSQLQRGYNHSGNISRW